MIAKNFLEFIVAELKDCSYICQSPLKVIIQKIGFSCPSPTLRSLILECTEPRYSTPGRQCHHWSCGTHGNIPQARHPLLPSPICIKSLLHNDHQHHRHAEQRCRQHPSLLPLQVPQRPSHHDHRKERFKRVLPGIPCLVNRRDRHRHQYASGEGHRPSDPGPREQHHERGDRERACQCWRQPDAETGYLDFLDEPEANRVENG